VVDYTRGNVLQDLRELAPEGVDAVFDHVGGDSLRSSYTILRPGGFRISYRNTSLADKTTPMTVAFLGFFALKLLWSFRPGGRRMTFFDVWGRGTFGADKMFLPRRFWREFREDLGQLVQHLAAGRLKPHVARRLPLQSAAAALAAHKGGAFTGKIVLEARALPTAVPSCAATDATG
jgi:NADPH:quinone reductase-like Zn-dependent oxidoreductase